LIHLIQASIFEPLDTGLFGTIFEWSIWAKWFQLFCTELDCSELDQTGFESPTSGTNESVYRRSETLFNLL